MHRWRRSSTSEIRCEHMSKSENCHYTKTGSIAPRVFCYDRIIRFAGLKVMF